MSWLQILNICFQEFSDFFDCVHFEFNSNNLFYFIIEIYFQIFSIWISSKTASNLAHNTNMPSQKICLIMWGEISAYLTIALCVNLLLINWYLLMSNLCYLDYFFTALADQFRQVESSDERISLEVCCLAQWGQIIYDFDFQFSIFP